MKRILKGVLVIALMLGSFLEVHATPIFTITDLGTLGGGTQSEGFGINDSGQVSGDSLTLPIPFGTNHAFIYDGNIMNDLGTLNPSFIFSTSFGRGINNLSQTVGRSFIPDGTERAFLFDGTTLNQLGTLGGTASDGQDINDSGMVTGFSNITGNLGSHAFFYDGAIMYDLGTLGGPESFGRAINSTGQIAGYSDTTDNVGGGFQQAFFYDGTDMIDLGTLGGTGSSTGFGSRAFGINDLGHVVGTSETSTGQQHAFLWDGSVMFDLGALDERAVAFDINNFGNVVGQTGPAIAAGNGNAFLWNSIDGMLDLNNLIDPNDPLFGTTTLINARSINSSGQITGQAIINEQFRAYLLTPVSSTLPVPEPATLTLFATGLAGLGFLMRRRRRSMQLQAA